MKIELIALAAIIFLLRSNLDSEKNRSGKLHILKVVRGSSVYIKAIYDFSLPSRVNNIAGHRG